MGDCSCRYNLGFYKNNCHVMGSHNNLKYMFHITFTEAFEDFWRNFKTILIHESISKNAAENLTRYNVISDLEGYVVSFQLPGEYSSDLLTYLLKMRTKASEQSRFIFKKFLIENNSFYESSILWHELGKNLKQLIFM